MCARARARVCGLGVVNRLALPPIGTPLPPALQALLDADKLSQRLQEAEADAARGDGPGVGGGDSAAQIRLLTEQLQTATVAVSVESLLADILHLIEKAIESNHKPDVD